LPGDPLGQKRKSPESKDREGISDRSTGPAHGFIVIKLTGPAAIPTRDNSKQGSSENQTT